MNSIDKFIKANKKSPVISAEWLNKDKRFAYGPPDTWMFHRITLRNGQKFTLTEQEMSNAGEDFSPVWDHMRETK